jgi:hypothetical protein
VLVGALGVIIALPDITLWLPKLIF